jgi:hypothetical protein
MAERPSTCSHRATDEEIASSVIVDPENAPVHPAAFRKPFSKDMQSINEKRAIGKRCAMAMEIYAEMLKKRIDLVKDPKELDVILEYMDTSKNIMYMAIEKLPPKTPQTEMERWLKKRKTSHESAACASTSSADI